MKTDAQLKKDVEAELEWNPAINASRVGVAVQDGVVALTGHIDTYAEEHAIERTVREVEGVRGIALELDVKLDPCHHRSDLDIAAAAERCFSWHVLIPSEDIQIMVNKGWVTLKGEVNWDYQRREAEKAVRSLVGVVGVSNGITLKEHVAPVNVSRRIHDALARHADSEAKGIKVSTDGGEVRLRGSVGSWSEREQVNRAAWSAPGVTAVVNELHVRP